MSRSYAARFATGRGNDPRGLSIIKTPDCTPAHAEPESRAGAVRRTLSRCRRNPAGGVKAVARSRVALPRPPLNKSVEPSETFIDATENTYLTGYLVENFYKKSLIFARS